jgi:Cu+-exporting ATPase
LDQLTPAEILEAIEDIGFEATRKQVQTHTIQPSSGLQQIHLRVSGMTCSACSTAVETTLTNLPGVRKASVALTTEEALVQFDNCITSVQIIMEAVEDAGFEVEQKKEVSSNLLQLRISGMTCSACSTAVEKGLGKVRGVQAVGVNLLRELAEVRFDPGVTGPRALIAEVADLGFEGSLYVDDMAGRYHRRVELEYWQRLLM